MRKINRRICDIPKFKCYNYALLIYMEDLEKNGLTYGDLLKFLDSLHMKCAVSPIHDMDTFTPDDVWSWCERHLDPETGDLGEAYIDSAPYVGKTKKPHVHLLFMNRSKKSVAEMQEIFCLMDVRPTMWDKAHDPFSLIRYFAHLDSPEKYPYSAYDIHGFGGINLDALLMDDSKVRVNEIKGLIMDLINDRKILYFYQLVNIVRNEYPDREFENVVYGCNSLFNAVIRSKREARMDRSQKKKSPLVSIADEELIG